MRSSSFTVLRCSILRVALIVGVWMCAVVAAQAQTQSSSADLKGTVFDQTVWSTARHQWREHENSEPSSIAGFMTKHH